MSGHGRTSGFTLLELLVGLALLSLIATLLAGALGLGIRAEARSEARIAAIEDLRATHLLLRRHIEAAQPMLFDDEARGRIAFEGRANGMDFVALMVGRDGLEAPHMVRLALDEDAGGALVLLRRPLNAGPLAFVYGETSERAILAAGMGDLGFEYYDGRVWRDSWGPAESLPALVRIAVAEGGRRFPELVVAPRLKRVQP